MNGYGITRNKFLSVEEMRKLLRVCRKSALSDMQAKRRTWVTRYMVVHLAPAQRVEGERNGGPERKRPPFQRQ